MYATTLAFEVLWTEGSVVIDLTQIYAQLHLPPGQQER